MARRSINGADPIGLIEIVAIGAGVYMLYRVIKPVTDLLPGSEQDQANQQKVSNVLTTTPEENPFNINFVYSLYANNPGTYNAAWWQQLHTDYDTDPQFALQTSGVYKYVQLGDQLIDAFGFIIEHDADVDTVFGQVKSQADVSNIAAYLYFQYNEDLYSLMRDGKGVIPGVNKGLSTAHLAQIVDTVNSLPESN